MTIQHDAAQERGEKLREAWEASLDPALSGRIAELLADYLLDNFRELHPWKGRLDDVLVTLLSRWGSDDELATLGEVFGEAVSWETWQKQQPAEADPFHSDDPRVP